jgi:hypothetical protein
MTILDGGGSVRIPGKPPAEPRKGGTAVYPYSGTPGEGLRSSYGVLSGRGDGATVLAAGQHALGLALHLPYSLAGDT